MPNYEPTEDEKKLIEEVNLKVISFEESAEKYFTEQMNEAARKAEYWARRAEGKSPISREWIMVEKYTDKMNFYIYALNRCRAEPVKVEEDDTPSWTGFPVTTIDPWDEVY